MRRAWLLSMLLLLGAGPAAPLRVVGPHGEPVALAPEASEPSLVVHFWASWCPTCLHEIPELDRIARGCAGRGVRVVGVNVGEDAATVERFVAEHELALPMYRDPDGDAWRAVSRRELPANLLWTPAGRRAESGPHDARAWAKILGELGCEVQQAADRG